MNVIDAPIADARIKELRRLGTKATTGPWSVYPLGEADDTASGIFGDVFTPDIDGGTVLIATLEEGREADGELIVAMLDEMPSLLIELTATRADLATANARIAELEKRVERESYMREVFKDEAIQGDGYYVESLKALDTAKAEIERLTTGIRSVATELERREGLFDMLHTHNVEREQWDDATHAKSTTLTLGGVRALVASLLTPNEGRC